MMALYKYCLTKSDGTLVKGYHSCEEAQELVERLIKQYSGNVAMVYVEFDCEEEDDLLAGGNEK